MIRSLALATTLALLLAQCANLDCPAGRTAVGNACVCSNTQEPPVDGMCPAPIELCDQEGCTCTLEGIKAAIERGGTQRLKCTSGTIVSTEETLVIDKDVVLDGGGNLTVQGNNLVPVFDVQPFEVELVGISVANGSQGIRVASGASVTLTDVTVRNNASAGSAGAGISNEGVLMLEDSTVDGNLSTGSTGGGGLYNGPTGVLTLVRSAVTNNDANGGSGGGILNDDGVVVMDASQLSNGVATVDGGGVSSSGTLTVRNRSTIFGNTAQDDGGGIYMHDNAVATLTDSTVSNNTAIDAGGGIFSSESTLDFESCAITGNSAVFGGGLYTRGTAVLEASSVMANDATDGGGIYNRDGSLALVATTLSGNTATLDGAGLYNRATAIATNCTASGNTADDEGGAFYNSMSGDLTLTHCTIADNTGKKEASGIGNDGQVTLNGTVIAGTCRLGSSAVFSGAGNIESPGDTCTLLVFDNQVDVDPTDLNLGPLQDNEGPTLTQAPLSPSVAIDQIEESSCLDAAGEPLEADQRGVGRPQAIRCDIGAVEVVP